MSFRVDTIDHFEKEAKRLKKKFPSLKSEIYDLVNALEENPKIGIAIGKGFYKIRLAIHSKGKGKRGGARVRVLDFEDGLEYYAALMAGCKIVVTEDIGDFYYAEIEVLDSKSFLRKFFGK